MRSVSPILALALSATVLTAGRTAARQAPPPATDIVELAFDGRADGLAGSTIAPVSRAPGYDNQPSYTPDGSAILFAAARGGGATDIYEFDRATRRVRPLIVTAEAEYSPSITPDGQGVSVIRVEADKTQRLWRFDRNGQNPRVILADIKPVGYHLWADAERLVLFVLGPPATLHLARVSSGTSQTLAHDIGRSLQRIPGGQLVSFVAREGSGGTTGKPSPDYWVNALNPTTGAIFALTRTAPGSVDRDCAWLADGTLLMSAGQKIFAWRTGAAAWREVFDGTTAKLGPLTRMAVSPDGKSLAAVVGGS